jgi:hypothetical protein
MESEKSQAKKQNPSCVRTKVFEKRTHFQEERKEEREFQRHYDNFRDEIETVQEEEFLIEIDEKVLVELSESEIEMKEEDPEDEPSEESGKQFTPDEEFRLLQVYFKEMGMEPLLTPKEEIEVSAKIKRCEARAAEMRNLLESVFQSGWQSAEVLYRRS